VDDWEGLRTVAVIAGWITVLGGLGLAVTWLVLGGGKAVGPDDELMAQSGVPARRSERRYTAFSSVQVGVHGLLRISTASLLTYAAARADDRSTGYAAVLVVAAVTAVPGLLMYRKWKSDRRPAIDGNPLGDRGPKVEDELPKAIVYLHGIAACTVVVLLAMLLVVE
jgi:hypothetical protein